MKIVSWMLIQMIATRFLAVLIGISLFVLSLEAVSYAPDILKLDPGHPSILLRYVMYRSPQVLATFLPISMLIAMLLALTELSYRNEIPALWSAGLSPFRVLVLLLPLAFIVGGANFLLNNMAVPAADPTLREWAIGDYSKAKLKVNENDPLWMRAGTDILRAETANANSTELKNLIIFRRDPDGLLREQIFAQSAKLEDARWTLSNVIIYYRGNQEPNKLSTMVYSGGLKPAEAGVRSGNPESMSISDLSYFIQNGGFGIRPVWVYETWWHKRLSLFFSGLVMIALCLPLATRFRRGGGLGVLFVLGIGLGFSYFIVDGISMTMGELGFVTPWIAAWLPVVAFGMIAAAMSFRAETV
ncbi:LptF/LptG family permease [Aestuariivirga sp.]|uniref:LptF/LptG family permease n=1 Tax=Aestuariivirga sp. TaxID=2650926 RepID=UPI0039E5A136